MRAAGGCQPPNPAFSALFRAVFRAWRVGKRKVRDGFFPKNRAGRSAPKRAFVAGIKELDRAMRFFAATQAEMNTLRRYNVWLMAAGFVLLFGAGIAALLLAGRARETAADVTHTIEVRSELLTILNLLQGAEAGQRGYLLTRDEQYLEPYTAAHRQIDEELAVLENLVAGHPIQRTRMEQLRRGTERLLANIDETIELGRQGRFDAATAIVDGGRGKALMDEARDIVANAMAEEDMMLSGREARAARSATWLFASLIGALGATLVLAILSSQFTRRRFMSLAERRDQLARLNEALEERVKERTRELEISHEMAEAETGRAEYERGRVELLLREMTHRVGNNLAMISSLLRMQEARLSNPEARSALETARGRIQTIGAAQRRLRLGTDLQSTRIDGLLEAVVSDLADATLESETITLTSDFEPLIISARDATTLAVVLGELVSNAIKHAFHSRSTGTITASFTLRPDGVPVLAVLDDGDGYDDPQGPDAAKPGLGTMIIDNLSRQYGGEIRKQRNDAGGTSIYITLPKLNIKETENIQED
tara:strand:+ start:773 stop:2392 length:1620 start_codon:yes stop_codon:yes gene_type:complete